LAKNWLVPASECLAAVDGGVGTFPLAAGEAIEAKRSLEDRLEDACQGVMHNPVSERCGADLPRLACIYGEDAVRAWMIALGGELSLETKEPGLEMEEETRSAWLIALAASGGPSSAQERFKRDHPLPQIADSLHPSATSARLRSQPPI
jgi:hypothetical protein